MPGYTKRGHLEASHKSRSPKLSLKNAQNSQRPPVVRGLVPPFETPNAQDLPLNWHEFFLSNQNVKRLGQFFKIICVKFKSRKND